MRVNQCTISSCFYYSFRYTITRGTFISFHSSILIILFFIQTKQKNVLVVYILFLSICFLISCSSTISLANTRPIRSIDEFPFSIPRTAIVHRSLLMDPAKRCPSQRDDHAMEAENSDLIGAKYRQGESLQAFSLLQNHPRGCDVYLDWTSVRLTIAVAVCMALASLPKPAALSQASLRSLAWVGRPFLAASFRL